MNSLSQQPGEDRCPLAFELAEVSSKDRSVYLANFSAEKVT
jgi:hypothetical protein